MSDGLFAGFARADITPKTASQPLAGYGATSLRMSATVQDPIYAHMTALRSGEEACLFITMDLLCIVEETVELWRNAIAEKTGLEKGHIYVSATHTHSAPDLRSALPNALRYRNEELPQLLSDCAARAVADLKPAKLSFGVTEVGREGFRLNFDRHYLAVEKAKKDSWTEQDLLDGVGAVRAGYMKGGDYVAVKHVEEADHSLQILRFAREASDDIILLNFAAHATVMGGAKTPIISSDYPGAVIDRLEELCPGTKCSFFQGCEGNLVALTELEEEGIDGITYPPRTPKLPNGRTVKTKSHYAYGDALAGYALKALTGCMKDSGSDCLAFRKLIYVGEHDHSEDHLLSVAQKVVELFRSKGAGPELRALCKEVGLDYHHCISIVTNAEQPETGEIELNAIRIGDCAIVTAPFENYSSTGEHVKAASPFPVTFFSACSCGYQSYLPNRNAHPESYEAYKMRYLRGTAEKLEACFAEMLNELR